MPYLSHIARGERPEGTHVERQWATGVPGHGGGGWGVRFRSFGPVSHKN